MPKLSESDINRFKSKIDYADNNEKCWNWTANRLRGYGLLSITVSPQKDIPVRATRIAYFLHTNIDPVGKSVLHKCDNPSCCNPYHLFLGTTKDNTIDMMNKGRGVYPKGSHHGQSKLKERDVLEIRKIYKKGNGTIIAKFYGVTQSVISRIINNKVWNHA